mmetsp:Transcript_18819/g.40859  ORF Transcript_18819/g.40859 Transcript_18819/m.40859 type:complete len:269 (-) Transcript_18819:286-1092(-)
MDVDGTVSVDIGVDVELDMTLSEGEVLRRKKRDDVGGIHSLSHNLAEEDVCLGVDGRETVDEVSDAGSGGQRDILLTQSRDVAIGERHGRHNPLPVDLLGSIVLDVALPSIPTRRHHVGEHSVLEQVVQRLPASAHNLSLHWSAILERAPSSRRPNLVKLPYDDTELICRPTSFNVTLHLQRLSEHAIVKTLLELGLSRLIVIHWPEVDVDEVIAWVVALSHDVGPLAFRLKASGTIVGRLTRMQRPMRLVEGGRHRFERRHRHTTKL